MSKQKDQYVKNLAIKNRKASYEYEFLDKYTAGIVLSGTEIKSVRLGKVNMQESFCVFKNGELWVRSMHISEYAFGNIQNHLPKTDRKLLLNKRELKKLEQKLTAGGGGLTIVPTRMFISGRGFAKLNIALAKGKKLFDKREDIKKKDQARDLERG